jgi:hypothetical protein
MRERDIYVSLQFGDCHASRTRRLHIGSHRREQPCQQPEQDHGERTNRHNHAPSRRLAMCRLDDGCEQYWYAGQHQEDDERRRYSVRQWLAFQKQCAGGNDRRQKERQVENVDGVGRQSYVNTKQLGLGFVQDSLTIASRATVTKRCSG